MKITQKQYILASAVLVNVIFLNMLFLKSLIIGLIFGFVFFWLNSLILSKVATFRRFKITFAFLLILSYISLLGAAIYYFYQLSNFTILLIIISIPCIILILSKNKKGVRYQLNINLKTPKTLNILYILLIIACFYILFTSPSTDSIRSPWDIIIPAFLFLYFLASIIIILKNKPILFIILHFILSFSIALIVYSLGYGFDSFIHQATEKIIYSEGAITPKPLYYLGQYSLVVIFAKLLQISAVWIDKLLVPVLSAVYLPITIYYAFRNNPTYRAPILFLAIPFSCFILTTPQSLANLYTLIIIFLSLYFFKIQYGGIILILLSLTTIAIHPLAGLPIFFFVLLSLLWRSKNILAKPALWIIFIISSICLPLALAINSKLSSISQITFKMPPGDTKFYIPTIITFPHKFNALLDLFYFYAFNWKTIFLIISMIGIYIVYKRKTSRSIYKLLSFFPIALLINYFLLKHFITFEGVIYYEQVNYADRVITLIFYFLTPLFLYAIGVFITGLVSPPLYQNRLDSSSGKTKLSRTGAIYLKSFFLLLGAFVLTASLYISYPRNDNKYFVDRGYNVSSADIKAVRWIEKNATGNYIVLANQAVSAAAVQEFGFKKYYKTAKGEIFYYPIPTGGPLYQYYLDMVYEKPTKQTMLEAMDLTGADQGYFVLNKYWWRFDNIVEYAKDESDAWKAIDDGEIYIFRYEK